MGRYYTSDKTKWIGPTHLGSSYHDPAKRISKFIFSGPADSHVPALRAAYENAIGALTDLRAKRSEAEKSGKFTPLGVTEATGEHALTNALPALRRARVAVDKVKAAIEERRARVTLKTPTDADHRTHSEIRAVLRTMSPADRDGFLSQNRDNPVVGAAIANAIPALSGVHPAVHRNIVAEQLERENADVLGELRDLEEVVNVVDRVTTLARSEMCETIGCSPAIFESIARAAEANGGELPMRIESRLIDGKPVEIARVYDFQQKVWRDATANELGRAA